MILAYPIGWSGHELKPGQAHRPWLAWPLVGIVLLLYLGERFLLDLPGWLAGPVEWSAYGRLYTDPQQGLFRLHQAWSHLVFHHDFWHVLSCLLLLPVVMIPLQRRLGTLPILILLVLLAPLTVSVHLMVGRAVPDPGMTAVLIGLGGALFALAPRLRVRWQVAWFVVVRFGTLRVSMSALTLVVAFIVQDFLRLFVSHLYSPMGVPASHLVAHLLAITLAGLGGYLIAQSLLIPGAFLGERPGSRIVAIATGQRGLDELEDALLNEDRIPLETLNGIADRCIAESRPDAARILATYLALRDPDNPAYHRLRSFLDP